MTFNPFDSIKRSADTISVNLLVDNAERMRFFYKIISAESMSIRFVFHTSCYTYFQAKKKNIDGEHILLYRKVVLVGASDTPCIEEVKNGRLYTYELSQSSISSINCLKKTDFLFVFSGFQVAWRAVEREFKGVPIFFEIGNFPDKYQCSVSGVNADSDAKNLVSMLGSDFVSEEDVESLRDRLLYFRPPHVDKKISSKILESAVNIIGDLFFHTLAPRKSMLKLIMTALSSVFSKRLIRRYTAVSVFPDHFDLFITQVTEDTQTLFQSQETVESALKKAIFKAKSEGRTLIVRLHPGEKNFFQLKRFIKLCELNCVLISNHGSLMETVLKADVIYTINSTGGVHSILFGKEVIVLGDSFYKDWSAEDVVTYEKYILKSS